MLDFISWINIVQIINYNDKKILDIMVAKYGLLIVH